MKRNISDIMHNADDKTVRRIAESYTAADKKTSERIYQKALSRMDMAGDDEVRGTDVVRRSPALHRVFLAAACIIVVCGAVFGIMKMKAPERKPVDDTPVIMATATTAVSDNIEGSTADTTHTVAVVTDEAVGKTTYSTTKQPVTSVKTAVSTDNNGNAVPETTRPASGTTPRRTTDRPSARTTAKTTAKTTDKTGTKTTTTAATTTQVKPMSKNLTLNDIIELSKKKDDLTWSDFTGYIYTDIGSGIYIWEFRINEGSGYTLWVGGIPPEKPSYIELFRGINKKEYPAMEGIDTKNGIDIRYNDVQSFINESNAQTLREAVLSVPVAGSLTMDDVIRLHNEKGQQLSPEDFAPYTYKDFSLNGDNLVKYRVTDGENWKLPKNEEVYLTLCLGNGRPLISATLHNADLSKTTETFSPVPYIGDGTATQFDLEMELNSQKPWFGE